MDNNWLTGIGPWAAGGAAVGAGLLKLLTLGSIKRKDKTEEADSLYDRAVKLIEILQAQVDKSAQVEERRQQNEERLRALVEDLKYKLEDCEQRNQIRKIRTRKVI